MTAVRNEGTVRSFVAPLRALRAPALSEPCALLLLGVCFLGMRVARKTRLSQRFWLYCAVCRCVLKYEMTGTRVSTVLWDACQGVPTPHHTHRMS